MRLKYPSQPMRIARALLCCLFIALHSPAALAAVGVLGNGPETTAPVYSVVGGTPMVMLTMARDHSLFFPAYNDLSDLDGDGVIDFRFKPQFEYQGLYDSYSCYSYDDTPNNPHFFPSANAFPTSVTVNNVPVTVPGPCTGTKDSAAASAGATSSTGWSGNFLNYVTTSRIDALRVALYGGTRDTDTATTAQNAATTILRRAYIPQDGHAWAKEYTSYAVDGYNINQYTLLAQPANNRRHFFGNLTSTLTTKAASGFNYTSNYPDPGKSCAPLNTCSDYAPLLRVITNSDKRVWEWASSQRPVLNYVAYPQLWNSIAVTSYGAGTVADYSVRVKVCVSNANGTSFLRGCQGYVNGALTSYKPTGILHDYGGAGLMNFGLMTGSYDQNMSGGRLRKNIGVFTNEYSRATGVFTYTSPSIVKQIDNLRIRNFNNPNTGGTYPSTNSYFENFVYKNGNSQRGQLMTEGYYGDWGNPIAEMMYESLRYFSGKTSATTAFSNGTSTDDGQVGLVTPSWTNPYPIGTGLSIPANWCAKPSMMVVSGNPSFDADQLPGNYFTTVNTDLRDSTNTDINTATLLDNISSREGLTTGNYFVGQSGATNDGAPTAKAVASLAQVRGLVPDETNSQGSYYAAAVAYFGKKSTLRDYGNGKKIDNVDTYVISLNDPLPKIVLPNGITIIPFARTILDNTAGNTSTISKAKGSFQPTNQIVGWYIESMDFSNLNNYSMTFRVNFEDSSWGNDFEMDVMARYEITGTNSEATVKVTPIANVVGGTAQNMGYVISGVHNANRESQDGTYLVAQSDSFTSITDSARNSAYFLNVPDGQDVGYCNYSTIASAPAACATLPYPGGAGARLFSTRTFIASGSAAGYLKEPLWYAAKWGGYADGQEPTGATIIDPDTYAKVSSPAKLKDTFINMLDRLRERSSASGAVSVSSQQLNTDSQILSTAFNTKDLTGQVNSISLAVTQASPSDTVTYAGQWTASAPAHGDKKIYYKNKISGNTSLREFTAANARADYFANFPSDALVNYLRGNAEYEVQNNGTFRTRNKWLGTTVNSTPAYSADTGMVYVGANDGMLHGLDAATGVEKFAYIPTSAIQHLNLFSRPAYTHRYLVDGDIAVSEKFKSGGINYLVGFLGRAGKGLYGLQVYKPTNANPSGLRTDGGAWENFGAGDDDMGYLLGQPVIEELADGTDVVIFGNGYNSINNRAALYVARLDNGIILAKFTTDQASSNGLATPGIVRSAGKAQYAYAGDYLGQVWKFDLSAVTGSSTAATARSGTKIFTALTASGQKQPITAPITTSFSYDSADTAVANKRFIFFGTGSDLSTTDSQSTQVQSIYGLIDTGTSISNVRGGLTGLQQRTIDATSDYDKYRRTYTVQTRSFSVPVAGDMAGKAGWYMDWSASGTISEKVFGAASVRSAVTPTLIVSSNIMNTSACATTGVGYLNAMDAYRGGGLTESYFDINRNGSYSDEVLVNGNVIGSIDFSTGSIGQAGFLGSNVVVQGGGTDLTNANNGNTADVGTKKFTKVSRRISWREIVK